jgi:hypothetical protein
MKFDLMIISLHLQFVVDVQGYEGPDFLSVNFLVQNLAFLGAGFRLEKVSPVAVDVEVSFIGEQLFVLGSKLWKSKKIR